MITSNPSKQMIDEILKKYPHYESVPCLVCGSSNTSPILAFEYNEIARARFTDESFTDKFPYTVITRCKDCGLEYQSPRPTEASLLDVINASYELRPLNKLKRELFEEDLLYLREHLAEGASLIDIGCNEGAFMSLAQEYYQVSGCDPIERAVVHGRETYDFPFVHGTIKDMPLEEVDAIVSLDSFEHFHNPREFLLDAKKRLRSGGIIYIRTLRAESINAWLSGKYWHAYAIWHLLYPRTGHIVRLAKETGLEVEASIIGRKNKYYLKKTLRYHWKRIASKIAPVTPELQEFRTMLEGGGRIMSLYCDEVIMILKKP